MDPMFIPTVRGRDAFAALARLAAHAAVVGAALLPGAAVQAQVQYFRCTDAEGSVQFSDRACEGAVDGERLVKPADAALPERRAHNDARLVRDKAWLQSIENARLAEEAAARAAQQRQLDVDTAIARRLAQERGTRNNATNSVLPARQCELCRGPALESPTYGRWP